MDESKMCTKCGESKSLTEFNVRVSTGKLRAWCKVCQEVASKIARAAARRERELNAKGEDYGSRNANLRRLGFASYAIYLGSDLWKEVRAKVYAAKGKACYLCGKPATELHHNRYHANDLLGKRLRFINPICRECHEGIEFLEGRKVMLRQAKSSFRKARKRHRERT